MSLVQNTFYSIKFRINSSSIYKISVPITPSSYPNPVLNTRLNCRDSCILLRIDDSWILARKSDLSSIFIIICQRKIESTRKTSLRHYACRLVCVWASWIERLNAGIVVHLGIAPLVNLIVTINTGCFNKNAQDCALYRNRLSRIIVSSHSFLHIEISTWFWLISS